MIRQIRKGAGNISPVTLGWRCSARPPKGVDAVETMVADVQGGTAVLAGVALDIKQQATENRILGPGGTPGSLSLHGHTLPSSSLVSRSFWLSSVPMFANP